MDGDRSGETIPTNLRLLLVLEEVAKSGVPVTPTDVNASLGLPKPTIHVMQLYSPRVQHNVITLSTTVNCY